MRHVGFTLETSHFSFIGIAAKIEARSSQHASANIRNLAFVTTLAAKGIFDRRKRDISPPQTCVQVTTLALVAKEPEISYFRKA